VDRVSFAPSTKLTTVKINITSYSEIAGLVNLLDDYTSLRHKNDGRLMKNM